MAVNRGIVLVVCLGVFMTFAGARPSEARVKRQSTKYVGSYRTKTKAAPFAPASSFPYSKAKQLPYTQPRRLTDTSSSSFQNAQINTGFRSPGEFQGFSRKATPLESVRERPAQRMSIWDQQQEQQPRLYGYGQQQARQQPFGQQQQARQQPFGQQQQARPQPFGNPGVDGSDPRALESMSKLLNCIMAPKECDMGKNLHDLRAQDNPLPFDLFGQQQPRQQRPQNQFRPELLLDLPEASSILDPNVRQQQMRLFVDSNEVRA